MGKIQKRKIFLSFKDEEKWLKALAERGYELVRAAPFLYEFERTEKSVIYEYIPLKNGKRGFDALDYKAKDGCAKAVYCKNDIALFKKSAEKGAFTIQSESEKRLALAKRKTGLFTRALIFLAVFGMLVMLASRLSRPLLYIPAALFVIASVLNFYKAYRLDK